MTEQWQELKETVTELRDNDGTGTQQEVCKFLANLMDVLEKQMQEPCEDAISRACLKEAIHNFYFYYGLKHKPTEEDIQAYIDAAKPVTPQPKADVLDKIRAEIEEQVLESLSDGGDDWFVAEKVNECLEIIDKHKAESEE